LEYHSLEGFEEIAQAEPFGIFALWTDILGFVLFMLSAVRFHGKF